MLAKLRWYLDAIRYELRDPYDVVGIPVTGNWSIS